MQIPVPDVSSRSLAELVSLAGRRAVVTGAGRGLGRAIAERLAEAGADVLVADIEDDLATAAAEDLDSRGKGRALAAHLDVTDVGSVVAAADLAVREFGGVDIWVNNAGIFPGVPALEMSAEAWDEVFAVNARGVFLGSREAARRMSGGRRGGVIVNVVSTAGFRGTAPGLAAYVGSKHAARGITRQLALEFAPFGIRVLGVAPTFVPTEGNMAAAAAAGIPLDAESLMSVMQPGPLGRLGVPDDIARVVLFCASDLSAFMTGSTLLADAGETI
ncbi:Diacetyl reductase [(S-acetoin forming]) [Streptomyces graminofaciens]|uniref:Diacetyl reductase [(S-acetoin forming]) n=1 Tax=Streptomyces graminofaciens TaxID=68212 RepID=A0ABN5VEF7_9ACTN|nr:glucose 1-dehydrogenase [Streptomyces graminofaciens]BBC31476.1 Diacetyl reductase [(S-acetoin forming]) [Streptomyces graminofaciens]